MNNILPSGLLTLLFSLDNLNHNKSRKTSVIDSCNHFVMQTLNKIFTAGPGLFRFIGRYVDK
jgi:hypothetical protein